jgi:tetrapyrrole methylase family protein / MazG family protein
VITIVGLGPSGQDSMTVAARRAVESARTLLFRTGRHPAAADLSGEGLTFETFDHVYDAAGTFEEVYQRIADDVMERAAAGGDVTYCVPGHPLVGEEAVRLIIRRAGQSSIPVEIIGSPSFLEATLEAVRFSIDEGLKVLDALSISLLKPDPDVANLFYQVHDQVAASELKLALLEIYPDEFTVYLVQRAGAADGAVEELPLFELDRRTYDHLTSVLVPRLK